MDYQNIKKLLEKYWEGKTSLEEEVLLKKYFTQTEISPKLKQYKPLFQYLVKEQKIESSLTTKELKPKGYKVKLWSWKRWTMVAASVTVLAMASLWLYPRTTEQTTPSYAAEDTYSDPNEAYNEVKAALLLVSTKLNKGVAKTKKELKSLSK